MALRLTCLLQAIPAIIASDHCFEGGCFSHISLLQTKLEVEAAKPEERLHSARVSPPQHGGPGPHLGVVPRVAAHEKAHVTSASSRLSSRSQHSDLHESEAVLHKVVMLLGRSGEHLSHSMADSNAVPIAILVFAVFILLMFATYWRASHVLGNVIASAIMTFDKDLLGVDVEMGDVGLNPFSGSFEVDAFKLHNAAGYNAPYLMTAKTMRLDIDILKYIFTCGKHVTVQEIEIKDAHIWYEKSMGGSNVDSVLSHMAEHHDAEENRVYYEDGVPKSQGCIARMMACGRNLRSSAYRRWKELEELQYEMGNTKVKRVKITNVRVTVEARGFANHGIDLCVEDLEFADLTKQSGGSPAKMVRLVLGQLLQSASKSTYQNLMSYERMAKGWTEREASREMGR